MKTDGAHIGGLTRLLAALAAAAAGLGVTAGIAVSASRASCTHTSGCQNSQNSQRTNTQGEDPQDNGGPAGNPGDRHADPQEGILPLQAQAKPILGRRVTLDGVSGTVLVKAPGSASFVALANGGSVPVGSTVDATSGAITLTSVKDAGGTVQHGRFWGGQFRVQQLAGAHPATVLVLVDNIGACPTAAAAKVTSAGRRVSRLWGRDNHGRFVTRGHYGVASVRGTAWLTQDTCSGTLVRVTRGTVVVRDFDRHRKVRVTTGHSYLARR